MTPIRLTAALAVLFLTSQAFANPAETFEIPLAAEIDTCVETVNVEGTIRVVQSVATKENGMLLVSVQVTIKGKGIGVTSGTQYEFVDTIHQRIKTSADNGGLPY